MSTTTERDWAAELEKFRADTRRVIIETNRDRRDYLTSELRDEALANLGLAPVMPPQTVMVEVTMTRRMPVTIDDVPSYEDAAAKVAAMGEEEIVTKLRNGGGYVSHRVLDRGEAPPDPLGWITMENSGRYGDRRREAIRACEAEIEELSRREGHCTTLDTGGYHCCRGQGHVGQHVATGGSYVLAVWDAPAA